MNQRTTSLSLAFAAVLALVAAGCGSDTKSAASTSAGATTVATTAATTATTTAATTAATTADTTAASTADTTAATTAAAGTTAGATVQLTESTLGTILADAEGRTLYVFTKDSGGTSACSGGCATAWPPFTATVTPGTGLDAEDFATITRDDGSQQVTFYGHPLYTFAGDAKPGDVTGQGSNGVWYVIGADGNPIETAASVPGY